MNEEDFDGLFDHQDEDCDEEFDDEHYYANSSAQYREVTTDMDGRVSDEIIEMIVGARSISANEEALLYLVYSLADEVAEHRNLPVHRERTLSKLLDEFIELLEDDEDEED